MLWGGWLKTLTIQQPERIGPYEGLICSVSRNLHIEDYESDVYSVDIHV